MAKKKGTSKNRVTRKGKPRYGPGTGGKKKKSVSGKPRFPKVKAAVDKKIFKSTLSGARVLSNDPVAAIRELLKMIPK